MSSAVNMTLPIPSSAPSYISLNSSDHHILSQYGSQYGSQQGGNSTANDNVSDGLMKEDFNLDELFLEEFEELNNSRGKKAVEEADK